MYLKGRVRKAYFESWNISKDDSFEAWIMVTGRVVQKLFQKEVHERRLYKSVCGFLKRT